MRKPQDSHDIFNQVSGYPYLGEGEEHSDVQALTIPADNPIEEKTESLAVPQEWSPFLEPLSLDGALPILARLETRDLQSVSFVNKKANFLARTTQLKRYKDALEFSQSCLWQYLPAIAQDVPNAAGKAFINYVEAITNLKFNGDDRTSCEKLSSCMVYMRNREGFPANWSAPLTQTASELQTLAQEILAFYPADAPVEPPKNLKAFMNLCSAQFTTPWQELNLWQKYHKLDSQLSTFLLFYRIHWVQWRNQLPGNQQNQFNLVCNLIDPRRSGLLTGSGLMLLDSGVPGIFSQLVNEALWWFGKADKTESQSARLKNIERLLERLTEADLLRYIPNQYFSRENPPADDPSAVFVDLRQRWVVDPKRALLILVIQSNYMCLMKKLTASVLFKIEDTLFLHNPPWGEYPLNHSRIIPLILTRPVLLRNLRKADIVKLLCIPQSIIIPEHPFLWPYLSYEVIQEWFRIDNLALHGPAQVVLSNATILKSLTNAQIISIAQHLGPQEISNLLDNPVFRARLEEDKGLNDHREKKLLMQLMGPPKNFEYQITQNDFAVSLLTRDEVIAILFPKSGKCETSVIGFLLHKKGVISHLSSAQLLQAVNEGFNCDRMVAESYLTQFNDEDLITFSKDCFILIRRNNRVELNVLLQTLPPELENRAEKLTSAQWLELARMHPQIGHFIVDRLHSKLADVDIRSLSQHYKENSDLLQKITALTGARAQEKGPQALQIQENLPTNRRLDETRTQPAQARQLAANKTNHQRQQEKELEFAQRSVVAIQIGRKQSTFIFSPPPQLSLNKENNNGWLKYLSLALLITLGLIGFSFFMLGIGSALGISLALTITTTLFSFLPCSAALSSFLIGYFVYLASSFFTLTLLCSNKPEAPTKTQKSSCSTANFFQWFDCCSDSSDIKATSQAAPSPKIHFQPPPVKVGFQPASFSEKTVKIENEDRQTFSYYQ